jgi:D-alanyl-D-alanine carboxypeptidase/D-alanyl-D-alanine-endopeptidase (penicillin-binding protein 4)
VARPDSDSGGPDGREGAPDGSAPDVVRPGTGVVRPGSGHGAAGAAGVVRPAGAVPPATDVVRPGSDVVRPGTDVVRPGSASVDGSAKAVAAVPDAPEAPLEPIHIVLPVIPVKPAKQGFLDRLVAGKSEAERAAEEARREEESRRKAEQARRRAEAKARREAAETRRKAEERAQKKAEEARQAEAEAEQKAQAKADQAARRQAEARREVQRAQQRADEKARRAQERALQKAREDDEFDEDERYDDEVDDQPARGPAGPSAPPRPPSTRPGPSAPPRPPAAPPRPGARPRPAREMPGRGPVRATRDDRYERYEARRAKRPLWQWIVATAAVVALGGGSAAVAGVVAPEPVVVYQPGIDTGGQAPILGLLDGGAPLPSRAGLEAALGPLLGASGLGSNPAAVVADGGSGDVLWERRGDAPLVPASAAKVLTAAAVLVTRGPNHRIPTQAVAGASPGDVVLVGGGDPTLAAGGTAYYRGAARLDQLAAQVRAALGGTAPGRVVIDGSLYTGPTIGPSGSGNLGSAVTHITALTIDGGRADPTYRGDHPRYHQQPDLVAGRAFARALGVPDSRVVMGTAPAGARVLGEVLSPPVAGIVEQMLAGSDNVVAEALARQVAIAKAMPASFSGGAQATHSALAELGLPMTQGTGLVDGSGLSRDNRVTANHLVAVLTLAASPDRPQLRSVLSGLAVAGYSGTLDDRGRAGRGVVRAKTGTLTGVSALVGYVVDADGRLLAFAVIANGTPGQFPGEAALDRLAERLSRCGCG